MSESTYTPPKVWTWDKGNGGRFANINRPVSGATHEQVLPEGEHPLQLHSLATPNGVKVTVMLEELLELGRPADYDAYLINIGEGQQFGSGFVDINPNSKIPALLDRSTTPGTRVFESGAILLYLAEKFDAFVPKDPSVRAECYSWLMWQMGSAPYLGGGFGHFYAYAPEKWQYPIDRFAMEVKRQLDVLDKTLAERTYLCGDDYTIADMICYPWCVNWAGQGQDINDFKYFKRWFEALSERPGVQRGMAVGETLRNDPAALSNDERAALKAMLYNQRARPAPETGGLL
ncbi:MAG TPA: glutathione-dependent disulfide-bond oxidoreductase [Gammaproteobacteria bacterium]|nr:glutathione-dependent disulfide-bond oxidoreductase [Gammaproteobacteria bacterium]